MPSGNISGAKLVCTLQLQLLHLAYRKNPAVHRSFSQVTRTTMAAASMKLSLTFVLLLSALVVSSEIGGAMAEPDCSTIRCIQGGYITCDNYPYQKLDGCACVCAPKNGRNCVLHLQSGSTSNCSDKKKE